MPDEAAVRAGVAAALAAFGDGPARVRVTTTPRPTLLIEVTGERPRAGEPTGARATALRGAWLPGDAMAEHKSLSYARHRRAQRHAGACGADHALLLDADGRLGEAALASAFCAVGGELITAPAHGLLPGVARAVVLAALDVNERAAEEAEWRAAEEIVLTNAVQGAIAVVEIDGRVVGTGAPGPWAHRIDAALRGAEG
jgi:branched-chain amino acid aminotransferase